MSTNRNTETTTHKGFTLVEMLIVAPIVLLVIGIFVSAIVNMTGSVLTARSANTLAYNIQNALDTIDLDVRLSGGYLASNSIALQSGQGYDDGTASFDNASATTSEILILNSYATTGNPMSASKNYVYAANQPNACDSPTVNQNSPVMFNIIYFVKNNTLWRRVVAPANYSSVGCKTPWQKPTCASVGGFCTALDTKLVEGVSQSGLDTKYYTKNDTVNEITNANNIGLSDSARQAALNTASTVSVSITASGTVAGRDINRSGQIRSISPNDNTVSQIITTQPSDATVNAGSDASFTAASSGAGSTVQWQQSTNNGGSWSNISEATSTTLTRTAVTNTMDGYRYRAVFTTGLDTVTSTAARLTVNLLSWSSFALQNSWSDYGSGYQTNGYRKTSSGIVQLKGLIKRTGTAVSNEVIGVLPASYRPAGSLFFLASTNPNTSCTVNVESDGEVRQVNCDAGWFSLDNIHFVADNGRYDRTFINAFSNGWSNYGGWADASYVVDDVGRVHTQGLLSTGTLYDGAKMFDLPNTLLPSKYMHLSSISSVFGAFSIASRGTSTVVAKVATAGTHLSVNSMYYPANYSGQWKDLTMANSWVWYSSGSSFSTPQYTKSADGLVSVKGLICKGRATSGTVMATLPVGYRPAATVLYAGYSMAAYSRVDINSAGNIIFRRGSASWLSLDGITFYADQ